MRFRCKRLKGVPVKKLQDAELASMLKSGIGASERSAMGLINRCDLYLQFRRYRCQRRAATRLSLMCPFHLQLP